jgi:hypothetical protein
MATYQNTMQEQQQSTETNNQTSDNKGFVDSEVPHQLNAIPQLQEETASALMNQENNFDSDSDSDSSSSSISLENVAEQDEGNGEVEDGIDLDKDEMEQITTQPPKSAHEITIHVKGHDYSLADCIVSSSLVLHF